MLICEPQCSPSATPTTSKARSSSPRRKTSSRTIRGLVLDDLDALALTFGGPLAPHAHAGRRTPPAHPAPNRIQPYAPEHMEGSMTKAVWKIGTTASLRIARRECFKAHWDMLIYGTGLRACSRRSRKPHPPHNLWSYACDPRPAQQALPQLPNAPPPPSRLRPGPARQKARPEVHHPHLSSEPRCSLPKAPRPQRPLRGVK